MKPLAATLVFTCLAPFASVAFAQEPPAASTPPVADAPVSTPAPSTSATPAVAAPRTTVDGRPVIEVSGPNQPPSQRLKSTLSAGFAYQPPPPPKPAPAAPVNPAAAPGATAGAEVEDDDQPTAPDEQPRNGIVRLPKYIVEGSRPPVFTERQINTEKGLAEIAMKRYFSETGRALNRFWIPGLGMSPEAYAMMLYAEDERLQNMANLEATATNVEQVDPAAAEKLRGESERTFLRESSSLGDAPSREAKGRY